MVLRYEYRIIKEIATNNISNYQYELAKIAEVCNIMKFAAFRGYGYWENELHDIIRIEFSRSVKFPNPELTELLAKLDEKFSFGRSAAFVMYEEVSH